MSSLSAFSPGHLEFKLEKVLKCQKVDFNVNLSNFLAFF